MGKKRFKANTELLPSNYDDFFNKVYQDGNKYKDLSDNVFDKTETRRLDFDSHNQDELTGNENPFTSQFGNPNAEDPYNEYRANNQSSAEQAGLGLARAGLKAATEVAKLPGVIGGIGIMAADGLTGGNLVAENEGFETAFNNQWIKFFDGLNEDVKESLPVYIKESVKNGDFFDKIGSSAFYATEGADGAGYMLGALAPGGLFKWMGGANALFGASIKTAKLAKYGKNIQAAGKFLEKAGITVNNIDQYMIPAFMTVSESGAESKGVWDAMESRKGEAYAKYMSKLKPNDSRYLQAISLKNEELDQLRRSGEISIDEYNQQSANVHSVVAEEMFEKDFKEQKALAAQNTFFKNAVVLAGPNYIQAKLLFGKTPSKVLLDKIGGLGEKSIKNTFKQGTKNFVKGFALEGAEEVGQSAVEHRNIEEGLKFKLGDSRMDDYNPLTFGDDFIKTLGTTEGQVAGFLGGIMGAPMSAVGGYFQDKSNRKQTERLREKINGASTAYADIKNTNIYEQEEYTNPETGEVDYRDKEVDGKKVFIPENVAKVKNALNLIEKDSNEYDNAVEDGDVEKIEQFRNRGEFNVIANFIGEDEVTLDALHEHLKVAFPTENSKDISDEQVKINKTNLERIDKIMSKAKHLQKDFVSFKDMSVSILRINHPDITKDSTKEEKKAANEHLEDFLNRVGNAFLSERAEEYEAKQVLNKLEKQRLELENNSLIIEIENPNYIEGVSSEFDKKTKTRSNNPRLELVNSLIDKVKEQLKGYEENTNNKIWDNKYLNEQFAKEVEEINRIQADNSPEQIAKNDATITAVNQATNVEEVTEIENTAPKSTVNNPVIKSKIEAKKVEIIKAEETKNAEEIATATQEDNDFNNVQTYDGLTATDGSIITDELIPQQAENNTLKELKDIKTEEESAGKGAQVISTYRNDDKKGRWKSGDIISFMKEQFSNFLKYEKEPIDKSGKPVTFEINNNPGPNENVNKALILYNELLKRGFTNMTTDEYTLLYEYLPINVRFTSQVNAPIETKRVATFDEETGKWVEKMNISTGLLRTELISNLRKGVSFENMSTTIQSQYKGLLKVDENRFANNNILQLDGVKDLKYVRDNLYVVNSFGKLQNILNDKIFEFNNDKVKPNAAGEIYLTIPQANGKPFPLKLNIKKISESEAVLLYEIYKEIITNEKSLNTTVSEVNSDLQEAILINFEAELNIIGGNKNDIKLQEIVDLLIYQSANIKSQMQVVNGVLYYGDKESTIDTIEQDQNEIIDFLISSKRHQIKINPKSEIDNTKTNLKSNSADYLKYLVDNNILSTNAVVNEPTFQGYTNIYLNTGITINNKPQSIQDNTKADIEIRKQALKDLMKATGVEIYEMAVEDGSFNKEGFLDMDSNGNVILTRFADTSENLTKGGQILSPEEIAKGANNHSYKSISTSGIEGGVISYSKEGGVIGKYEIPLNELISLMKEGYVYFAGIGNKEFVLSPHIAEKYLTSINGKQLTTQPKVSESGVEVKTDNTGFDSLFGKESKVENKSDIEAKKAEIEKNRKEELKSNKVTSLESRILNLKNTLEREIKDNKDTKITNSTKDNIKITNGLLKSLIDKINTKYDIELTNLENKSENVRNVQENFVSLSEEEFLVKNFLENLNSEDLNLFLKITKISLVVNKDFSPIGPSKVMNKLKSELENNNNTTWSNINFKIKELLNRDKYSNIDDFLIKLDFNKIDITTETFALSIIPLIQNQIISLNEKNVQFTSLSEIPGTVENTELKETQAEVFNENKTPPTATEMRLINKAITVYQEDASKLTESQKKRLEEYATNYPESWKKICK